MANKKVLLILISLSAIAIIFVLWLKAKRIKEGSVYKGPSVKNSISEGSSSSSRNDSFPLSYGSRGNNVIQLQSILNSVGNHGLTADGVFGSKTKAALVASTGKDTITEKELGALAGQKLRETKAYDSESESSLNTLVVNIKKDLDGTSVFGRGASYPWIELTVISSQALEYVADRFQSGYGSTLFSEVDGAYFNPLSDVEATIKSRLVAIGKA